jgi:hypothetical protein
VPSIRLRVEERKAATPCQYRDTGGQVQLIPFLRLITVALIHPPPGGLAKPRSLDAMIDTGAWISAIRYDVWNELKENDLIEPVLFADDITEMQAGVAGQTTNYHLGRLHVGLLDATPRGIQSLPSVPVIAQLLLNPKIDKKSMPIPILLGLHLGVLDGRKLTRGVVPARPAPLATDRGAQYGQEWLLETA